MDEELKLTISEQCPSCLAYEDQIKTLQQEIHDMKAAIVDGSKFQAESVQSWQGTEDIADKVKDVAAEVEEMAAECKDVATECKDVATAGKDVAVEGKEMVAEGEEMAAEGKYVETEGKHVATEGKDGTDSQVVEKTGAVSGQEEPKKTGINKEQTSDQALSEKKNDLSKMGLPKILKKPPVRPNRGIVKQRFNTPRNNPVAGRPHVWSNPRGFNRTPYRGTPSPANANFVPVRRAPPIVPFSHSQPMYRQLGGMPQSRVREDPSMSAYFQNDLPLSSSDPRYSFNDDARSYGRQQSYQPPTYMDRLSGNGMNQNDFGYLEEEEMRQKADSIWREYMKDLQR
uniref:Uncharacterized protein n=1 Tax=Ditylenchus dipsaci TaxID=166011 RepID=A0A915D6W8_9BILA